MGFLELNKFRPSKKEEAYLEEYIELRKELSALEKDIEECSSKEKKRKLIQVKKALFQQINQVEEHFFNVDRGLWIGVAIELDKERIDKGHQLLYIPWGILHKHFVVYGTTGYGKSRLFALIMRQLIAAGWSLFAVDPKNGEKQEIASWLYEFAWKYKRNETVMRFMASYPELSDKSNPAFGMTDEEFASLCYWLSTTGTGVETADEKYFSGQVYRIAFGILSATRFLEKAAYINNEDALAEEIIKEVEKFMKLSEREDEVLYEDEDIVIPDIASKALEHVKDKEHIKLEINPFNRTLITFKEMAYFSQYDNLALLKELVENFPLPNIQDKKLLKELKELKSTAINILSPLLAMDKTHYQKIGDTFSVIMSQLAFGAIGKIFCSVRINPLRMKLRSKEGVLVLFDPAPLRFEKVSEMMMKIFLKMFLSLMGEIGASGRGMNRRVMLLVDEAKTMVFPGIEELYNKARQLGMSIGAFFQSKSDPKSKVGEVLADIIEDNTALQIFMKQISASSQQEIAQSFGTVRQMVNMHMGEVDKVDGRNTIYYEERAVIEPNHLDQLQVGEAYIRMEGKKYFVKFPIVPDPNLEFEIEMPKLESEIVFEQFSKAQERIAQELTKINGLAKEAEELGYIIKNSD